MDAYLTVILGQLEVSPGHFLDVRYGLSMFSLVPHRIGPVYHGLSQLFILSSPVQVPFGHLVNTLILSNKPLFQSILSHPFKKLQGYLPVIGQEMAILIQLNYWSILFNGSNKTMAGYR